MPTQEDVHGIPRKNCHYSRTMTIFQHFRDVINKSVLQ